MTKNPHLMRASLRRRIRRFYDFVNRHDYSQCYVMIDPRILDKPDAVSIAHYKQSTQRCLEKVGSIVISEVRIHALHVNEPTKLYEGRDFAIGRTLWEDEDGNPHEFAERWVLEDGEWFTRSTGLLWVEPSFESERVEPPISLVKAKR